MTDIRSTRVDAADVIAHAIASNEAQEEAKPDSADDTAEVEDEQPTQTELLRTHDQKREPSPVGYGAHGEGEHQMKGLFAEVNPIGPAMVQGDVERAIRVNVHQHGDTVASQHRDSRVRPGVNEHTDLAIANDTRVAGGREVIGSVINAPDPEGIIKEEAADITADLLEQEENGATVVLPEPVEAEVPPFTDRIPVMEYEDEESLRPRDLSDIQADKDEAYEEVEQAVDPDPANRDEIEEYDATSVVAETDPEALAETQDERSAEEAEAQAREEHMTPRPEDVNEIEPEIIVQPETIVDAAKAAETSAERERTPRRGRGGSGDDDDVDDDTPPPKSANKPDWVTWVAAHYDVSEEEADALTKEELIETYGE